MFEGDSAVTRAGKSPLVPMGGLVEGPACADMGARTPIGASGITNTNCLTWEGGSLRLDVAKIKVIGFVRK